jgi:hypothetical protein
MCKFSSYKKILNKNFSWNIHFLFILSAVICEQEDKRLFGGFLFKLPELVVTNLVNNEVVDDCLSVCFDTV